MWNTEPSSTMVIGWDQVSGSSPVLYYDNIDHDKEVGNYAFKQFPDRVKEAKGMDNHFVRLTGLHANTEYYFVIKDNQGISKRYSFKTAPDNSSERLSIVSGGDSRNYRSARRSANKMVSRLRPHCVTFGGDMTGGDTRGEWKDWFDDWQETIGPDGHMTPIIVARGNHEFSNRTLVDLFDVRTKGIYYAVTLGGDLLRIYTLNTLISSGGEQAIWLKNDLRQNKEVKWKMAQYHYAMRPHNRNKAERNDQRENWASLFRDYEVQLVVESDIHVVKTTYPIIPYDGAGHDEGFIRDDEKGTVYVGEGCWGAPLRQNNDDKAWTRNSGSFNQIKWIFVGQDGIEVRTVKVDNVARVSHLGASNIFAMPDRINLWEPSNGIVVRIPGSRMSRAETKRLRVLNFVARQDVNGAYVLNWNTINESPEMFFELQRSINGFGFTTIAHLKAIGGQNAYEIRDNWVEDIDIVDLKYRLLYTEPSGKKNIYTCKKIYAPAEAWEHFEQIKPRDGLLKVKYSLDEFDDVTIRLTDPFNKVMSKSTYKDQKPGNYLKSIDMNDFPQGRYLLVIKTGKGEVNKFQVINRV